MKVWELRAMLDEFDDNLEVLAPRNYQHGTWDRLAPPELKALVSGLLHNYDPNHFTGLIGEPVNFVVIQTI